MNIENLRNINDYGIVKDLESKLSYAKGSLQLYKSYNGDFENDVEYWENETKMKKEELENLINRIQNGSSKVFDKNNKCWLVDKQSNEDNLNDKVNLVSFEKGNKKISYNTLLKNYSTL